MLPAWSSVDQVGVHGQSRLDVAVTHKLCDVDRPDARRETQARVSVAQGVERLVYGQLRGGGKARHLVLAAEREPPSCLGILGDVIDAHDGSPGLARGGLG